MEEHRLRVASPKKISQYLAQFQIQNFDRALNSLLNEQVNQLLRGSTL